MKAPIATDSLNAPNGAKRRYSTRNRPLSAVVALTLLTALAGMTAYEFLEHIRIINARTREPAADPLAKALTTGEVVSLANDTALMARDGAERQIADSAAPIRDAHLSVIMADIDHFKNVNDQFGHPAGDEVLRQVARRLADGCRESDMPARYGGEEFVVIAPETTAQAAADFAERLRMSICSRPLEAHGKSLEVTASFGVAGNEGLKSPEDMIQAADEALYRAKSAGRNCVKGLETAPPPSLEAGVRRGCR